MPNREIIVIGTSAGGVELLVSIARALPCDIPAALFIVQHVAPTGRSYLSEILNSAGTLPASHPVDGEPIQYGHIYIAPPDHHLLVEHGHMHVIRGPKENNFRPAIDATLRTAARAYGPRVVGIILSGMLDDGTAGLMAVKRHGGCAIVQDPAEAAFPSMPESACRYVAVDAVLPIAEIVPELLRVVNEPIDGEGVASMSDKIDLEANISEMDPQALQQADTLGAPSPFSCPACGGVLAEFYDGDLLRFHCQVGHAFSRESVLAAQEEALDYSLWAAFRALDERVNLARRLARDAHHLNDSTSERRFTQLIAQAQAQQEQIRQAILKDMEADAMTSTDEPASES